MNIPDRSAPLRREAKLRYLDAEFQVLREGDHVLCAATGEPIALVSLRYWDVPRQVAYKTAEAAFVERFRTPPTASQDTDASRARTGSGHSR